MKLADKLRVEREATARLRAETDKKQLNSLVEKVEELNKVGVTKIYARLGIGRPSSYPTNGFVGETADIYLEPLDKDNFLKMLSGWAPNEGFKIDFSETRMANNTVSKGFVLDWS
jgi:hypothetical protein